AYHVPQFLEWSSSTYPIETFEFMIRRFDYAKTNESDRGYKPLPFQEIGFHGIRNTDEYAPLLRRVRDSIPTYDSEGWFSDFFWDIATLDTTTLLCLDEWFHSKDRAQIECATRLIQRGPAEIAFQHPAFAAHVLDLCAAVDEELARRCSGAF